MSALIALNGSFEQAVLAVTAGKAASTQRAYRRAIYKYQEWASDHSAGFSRVSVMSYKDHLRGLDLSPATINQTLATLRMLARELRFDGLDALTVDGINAIKNVPNSGRRLGVWLDDEEARGLLALPDRSTCKGAQQYLILALLMGCGLRRREAADLTFGHIRELDGSWFIADMRGKRNKIRSIPLAPWVLEAIDQWKQATGISAGAVLRQVNKADRVQGDGLTPQAIYNAVVAMAAAAGIADLAPHSLRRTWARKAYKMGHPLDQIQAVLGHDSLLTTQKYLGLFGVDIENPVYIEY